MLGVATLRVVTCTEDGRVAQISGAISAPAVGLVAILNSVIRIAVRGRRVERAPLVLAVSLFAPFIYRSPFYTARRQLIVLRLSTLPPPFGPMPLLLCLQNGAVWQEVSDAPAVLAPHVAVDVPGCLHGDAAACNRLGVGRARRAVNEYIIYVDFSPILYC